MENVDDFLESLLIDKGIDVEPEVRKTLIEGMRTKLTNEIISAAIAALSEEKCDELEKKLEDPNFTNEQMAEFVQAAGVDLPTIVFETMARFRTYYLGAGA